MLVSWQEHSLELLFLQVSVTVPIVAIYEELQVVLRWVELKVSIGLLQAEKRDVAVLAV